MRLKRTYKEAWAQIDVYNSSADVCLDFTTNDEQNRMICSILDEREVDDLITMLQYYKLQVWPNSKENH